MIDLTKETDWLQEWVNDPAVEGSTDLEERTFTAFEVEMIMNIHANEKSKEDAMEFCAWFVYNGDSKKSMDINYRRFKNCQ